MASITQGLIQQVKIDEGALQSIASTAYGVCSTAANETEKVVEMIGFTLITGITVHIKFTYGNTAENPTLKINNTTAKPIVLYGNIPAGTNNETSGWQEGAVVSFTYDGDRWIRDQGYNTNDGGIASSFKIYRQTTGYNLNLPILVSRTAAAMIGTVGVNDSYSENIDGVIWNDNTKTPTINPSTGLLTAELFSGSGASLTNLNASNLTSGTVNVARLADSGVTAGTYGTLDNGQLDYSDNFTVPLITVDAKGRITTIADKTLQLPAAIVDEKVKQIPVSIENKEYSILFKYTNNTDAETNYAHFIANSNKMITINPSTGAITAAGGFIGKASSATIADTASAVAWANVTNKPQLTIAGLGFGLNDNLTTYNITAASLRTALGLANALHFIGTTTLDTNGKPVYPSGYTPQAGDVFIVEVSGKDSIEYICTDASGNSASWDQLGDASSYKLKQTAVTDTATQDDITFVWRITQNEQGVISATKKTIQSAAKNKAGIVSTAAQSFSGEKTFINGIKVGETNYLTITNNSIQVTETPSVLYLQAAGGTVTIGAAATPALLQVYGEGYVSNHMGIGIEPDTASSGHFHTLKVNGSIGIYNGAATSPAILAHMDIATISNVKELQFYPETSTKGSIGLDTNRWNSLYLSSLISIENTSADQEAYITNGFIRLKHAAPQIYLAVAQSASTTAPWSIINNNGTLNISNTVVTFSANSNGFRLDRLFINVALPASISSTTPYLTVNGTSTFSGRMTITDNTGSTASNTGALVVTGGVGIGQNLNVYGKAGIGNNVVNDATVAIGGTTAFYTIGHVRTALMEITAVTQNNVTHGVMQFYPSTDATGSIGLLTERWNMGYFATRVNIGNSQTFVDINSVGRVTIQGETPTIELNYLDATSAAGEATAGSDWLIKTELPQNATFVDFLLKSDHIPTVIANNDTTNYLETYIHGVPNLGFTIAPRLYINAEIAPGGSNFYVHGLSVFSSSADDASQSTGSEILDYKNYPTMQIEKSIKMTHGNNTLAYLYLVKEPITNQQTGITEYNNHLLFYPETGVIGSLGTEDNRWKNIYVENMFNIAKPSDNYKIELNLESGGGYIYIASAQPTLRLSTVQSQSNIDPDWYIGTHNMRSNNTDNVCFEVYPVYLQSNTRTSTMLRGVPLLGFTIAPRLYINATLTTTNPYLLYVTGENDATGNIRLNGYTGIGTDSDTSNSPAFLILQDYFKLAHNGTTVAHFHYTHGNPASLQFYPESSGYAQIGLNDKRWKELYLSTQMSIETTHGGSSEQITLAVQESSGHYNTALVMNSSGGSSVTLGASDQNPTQLTLVGGGSLQSNITLQSKVPSISFDTSTNGKADWTVANNEGTFQIYSGTNAYLHLTTNAAIIKPGLYIGNGNDGNLAIDSTPYNLKVTGSIMFNGTVGIGTGDQTHRSGTPAGAKLVLNDYFLIVHDSGSQTASIAHFKYNANANSNEAGLEIYPETDMRGNIGLAAKRWARGYFTDSLSVKKTVSSISYGIELLTNQSSNSLIKMYGGSPKIEFGNVRWYIQDTNTEFTFSQKDGNVQIIEHYETAKQYIQLKPRLVIGNMPGTMPTQVLYVNGASYLGGNTKIDGDFEVTEGHSLTLPSMAFAITEGASTTVTNTIGGNTQPVYWYNGAPKALTYTANRLYYSSSTTTFVATSHYASATQIGINITSWPANLADTDKLYVNGSIRVANGIVVGNAISPSATNSYNLGVGGTTSPARWAKLFIGTADSYGGDNANATGFTPIYWNNGVPDVSSASIGSGKKPIFMSSGQIVASSATEGATNKFIYMNSGTLTATNATIGDPYVPTYMNAGEIQAGVTIQKIAFSFQANTLRVDLADAANVTQKVIHNGDTIISYILELVITSGFSYVRAPFEYQIVEGAISIYTSVATAGEVTGYILVATGKEFSTTSGGPMTITRTQAT